MDITYYTFTLYVFLLVCAAIWFYARVMHKSKKEDKGSYEKDQRLLKLYQNVEDMLNAFEEYTEDSKKEINKGLEEMRTLIDEIKKAPARQEKKEEVRGPKEIKTEKKETSVPVKKKPEMVLEDETRMKAEDRIPLMISRGMSKTEIAKELGYSVREVSLILDIKKIRANEE